MMRDEPENWIMNPDAPGGRYFEKYFTLEEAVAVLPRVRGLLEDALAEVSAIRDEIILSKRLLHAQKQSGKTILPEQVEALQNKYKAYEVAYKKWMARFAGEGIVLRDIERGLIDFPYYSKSRDEELLLCWLPEEDGIFYFHELDTGFTGRKPIALLPD